MRAFQRRLFVATVTAVVALASQSPERSCHAQAARTAPPAPPAPPTSPAPPRAVEPLPAAGPLLTRTDALERLKRENLVLLAARHRLTQARADVVVAGVWTNPNLTVNTLFATHGVVTGGN